jgi:hypothetical protein
MALHVHVYKTNLGNLEMIGDWEDGRSWGEYVIPTDPKMTAAETVEFFFLERDMVASWSWSKDCCGHTGAIHGQFVSASPRGAKAYKEVSYSGAHEVDLP